MLANRRWHNNVRALFAAGEQGVWYDPSDFSTLFQDAAGSTPVTAVGQPVGRILDKSGRGNHATQSTTTSRPILQQDGSGRHYLAFDGTDDSFATGNIDFTATDSISLVAGLRKLSDASAAIFCEHSLNAGSTSYPGSFYVAAPNATGAASDYRWKLVGSLFPSDVASGPKPAGTSYVLTGLGDISTDDRRLRLNGALVSSSPSDLGSGNLGNYPLFIGRRGNSSLPFNGRMYQLIIRGALTDIPTIQRIESYVNLKTGAY
jgi:hypothetical protein